MDWPAVVGVCIPTRERGNEETLPVIPAQAGIHNGATDP